MKLSTLNYRIDLYLSAPNDLVMKLAVQSWATENHIGVSLSDFTGCWVNSDSPQPGTRLMLISYPERPRDPQEMHRLAESLISMLVALTGETVTLIDPRRTTVYEPGDVS